MPRFASCALALAMAGALLAGCSAPAPPGAGPGPAAGARVLPWSLDDCAFTIVALRVDAERLRAHLPEGFQPAAGGLLAPVDPGRASLHVDVYDCAGGRGLTFQEGRVVYGSYYAPVEPPEALRESAEAGHFVKWDFLVQDPGPRATFVEAGLPAHGGDGSVALPPAPVGGPVSSELRFAGGGGFTFAGSLAGPGSPGEFPYVEFTPTRAGGLATWRVNATVTGSFGAGVVELLPGSWVAEVAGATRLEATVFAGEWTIHDSSVTLPRDTAEG